jgi:3'-phosphoadenosine 5'-phosphosulfate sulfotransferase (PAPS reductase)/FAD synthetase
MTDYNLNSDRDPYDIIDEGINEYGITKYFCLTSGGKDSMAVDHIIRTQYPDFYGGRVFTVTGYGSRLTRDFIVKNSHDNNIPLFLVWPREDQNMYNTAMKYGFASKASHRMWMGNLKYHTWRDFILRYGHIHEQKPAFISGVRRKESNARKKGKLYARKHIDKDGRMIFVKPFVDKDGLFIADYLINNDIKVTPVYDWANKSEECRCGSFAYLSGVGVELSLMKQFDPFSYKSLMWLSEQIKTKAFTPEARNRWRWGIMYNDEDERKEFDNWLNGSNGRMMEDYCGESCIVE